MKQIPLTRGLVALVDDADYEDVSRFKWHADRKGYARTSIPHPDAPGKILNIAMHRHLLGLSGKDFYLVDHVDGNKSNNQRANLRLADKCQNQHNQGANRRNTSGFKGVSWHTRDEKWQASIKLNGKRTHLGNFDTPEAAHEAYKEAAIKLHGAFACIERCR